MYDNNNCTNSKSSRQEGVIVMRFGEEIKIAGEKNKYITWVETEHLFFATVHQRPLRTGATICILHASQGRAL